MKPIDFKTACECLTQLDSSCAVPVRVAIVVLAIMMPSATYGQALDQIDADFNAYCRQHFPNSMYQKTNQSWGVVHTCNQGGTLQNINLSEACRLTTGETGHTISNGRVLCSGNAAGVRGAAARDAGTLDMARYCRESFPNSVHEARAAPTGVEHYCRQPGATGGFTLQKADLASACRRQRNVDGFRKLAEQVICVAGGDRIAGNGGGGGGGGGGGDGKGFPPLMPKDIVDTEGSGELFAKDVKYANLQGCGNADPDFRMKIPFDAMIKGLGGQIYQYMGLAMTCPGLTGGKIVKFQKVCNKFSGSNPPMDVRLLPWGVPVCWKEGRKWGPPKKGEAGWGLNSMTLEGVCNEAYHGRLSSAQLREKNTVALLKYKLKAFEVECFYMKRDRLNRILKKRNHPNREIIESVEITNLTDKELVKEISEVQKGLAAVERKIANTRAEAVYLGVDPAPLKSANQVKYDKKAKEIEERKSKINAEKSAFIDKEQIASDCSNVGLCDKQKLEPFEERKTRLDAALRDFKEDLADDLILKYGDAKSRKALEKLKLKLKTFRQRHAELVKENQRRWTEAQASGERVRSETVDPNEEGALLSDEDLEESEGR